MSSSVKDEKKAIIDTAAWTFNIVTSVGIIIVNKALMANFGFSFGALSSLFIPNLISNNNYFPRMKVFWNKM